MIWRYLHKERIRITERQALRRPRWWLPLTVVSLLMICLGALFWGGYHPEVLPRLPVAALLWAGVLELLYRVGYFFVLDDQELEVWQGAGGVPPGTPPNKSVIPYRDVRAVATGFDRNVVVQYLAGDELKTADFRPKANAANVAEDIRRRVREADRSA